MSKLIGYMASFAAYMDYLRGTLLCAIEAHDWRSVRSVSGRFSGYEVCDRCYEKRNFIQR